MPQITREVCMRERVDHGDDCHTDDRLIMRVARVCSGCVRKYPYDMECGTCQYNPAQYTTPRRAMLMRTACAPEPISEELREHWRYERKRSAEAGWGVLVTVILILGISFAGLKNLPKAPAASTLPEWLRNPDLSTSSSYDQQAAGVRTAIRRTAPVPRSPDYPDVAAALRRTADNVRDYNRDGVINCQDYAAAFMREYPSAQIIYNPRIGPTGHVFNRVSTPDGWLYIEPQNTKKWLMREAWSQYNAVKHLNQEVTREFAR